MIIIITVVVVVVVMIIIIVIVVVVVIINSKPGNELRNFDIRVAKTLSDRNGPKQDDDKLCVHYGPAVGTGATLQFNCTSSLLFGRYVTVLMPSQRSMGHSRAALHLCEVEVYGREPLREYIGILFRLSAHSSVQC